MTPMDTSSRSKGVARTVRDTSRLLQLPCIRKFRFDLVLADHAIWIVLALNNRSTDMRSTSRSASPPGAAGGIDPKCAASRKSITIDSRMIAASLQPHSARSVLGNRIQHRLNIRRRAGDDAQDFARRRLLLQRFLEFVEQRTFSIAITA